MTRLTKLRVLTIGTFLSLTYSNSLQAQTLEQAVKLMLYNEPEIQAANYDRLSSFEDWKMVRGDLRPQVTLNGSAGVQQRDRSVDGLVTSSGEDLFSRQIGISVRQLIYDGGLSKHQTRAAHRGYEVQELVERSMVEGRVVDLCEVYWEVLRSREQVREAQLQVSRQQVLRDMIKERVGNGGNRADLALVNGRLNLAVNSVDTQQLALENALIRFVRLTGQPASNLTRPTLPDLPDAQAGLVLHGNWDYQASVAALGAATSKYESVSGNRGPKIYLDAGGSVGQDVLGVEGEDNEARALIVMSWDLYRGGANKALQKREHWQVKKAEELVRAAEEQSEYLASILWKERDGSLATSRSMEAYVNRLEGVLSDYQEQFKVGKQDLLSILDVQAELYTAKTKLIDAQYNSKTTIYRILGVEGELTDRMVGEQFVRDYLNHDPDKDEAPESLMAVKGLPESTEPRATVSRPEAVPVPIKTDPQPEKKRRKLNPFSK
ncbi:MAG: TolC family protein [Verrucomicrobiota bacterium]